MISPWWRWSTDTKTRVRAIVFFLRESHLWLKPMWMQSCDRDCQNRLDKRHLFFSIKGQETWQIFMKSEVKWAKGESLISAVIQAFWSPQVEMVKEHSLIYLGLVFPFQGLQFWWWLFPQLSSFGEAGVDLSVTMPVLAFPLRKLLSTFNLSSGSCQGGWVSCSANCSAKPASPDTERQYSEFSVHVEDSKQNNNEKNFYWNWKN